MEYEAVVRNVSSISIVRTFLSSSSIMAIDLMSALIWQK